MILPVLLLLCSSLSSNAIFSSPKSTCSRDSQCGAFRRYHCLGNQFIFCFGERMAYTVPGKCLNRSNFFCGVYYVLKGGARPDYCKYRECAECLESQDCTGSDQYCSDYTCYTRDRDTTRNTS